MSGKRFQRTGEFRPVKHGEWYEHPRTGEPLCSNGDVPVARWILEQTDEPARQLPDEVTR